MKLKSTMLIVALMGLAVIGATSNDNADTKKAVATSVTDTGIYALVANDSVVPGIICEESVVFVKKASGVGTSEIVATATIGESTTAIIANAIGNPSTGSKANAGYYAATKTGNTLGDLQLVATFGAKNGQVPLLGSWLTRAPLVWAPFLKWEGHD
jgi:hypothetical protein